MTSDDRNDPLTARRDADQLNDWLDQRAIGLDVDHQGLEPSLLATVEAIASLGDDRATVDLLADTIDRRWTTLVEVPLVVTVPSGRDRRTSLGIVASPVGFPLPRRRSWPMGLVAAVAAVLLAVIVASDYGGLPGSPSTSTVMAAGAPTVVSTETVEPAACLDKHATVPTTPRTVASETAPALTRTVGSTVIACVSSQPRIVFR